MTNEEKPAIVVAVDGSRHSDATLRWAVEEATHSGAPLRILTVADEHHVRHLGRGSSRAACQRALDEALAAAGSALGADRVSGEVLTGPVDEAVLGQVAGARLLAVGKRGLHSVPRLLVGSTSLSLAGRAPLPTVVVPESWMQETHRSDPVVVGVDPAQETAKLLELAFARAEWLDAPLLAVQGHEHPEEEPAPEEADRLAGVLAPWQEQHPSVQVECRDTRNHPAMAVLDAAESAQLIVLGRHKDSRFAGFGFGSVTRAVLHYATCPVAVVPTD